MRPVDADTMEQRLKMLLKDAELMGVEDPAIKIAYLLKMVRSAPTIDLEQIAKQCGSECAGSVIMKD